MVPGEAAKTNDKRRLFKPQDYGIVVLYMSGFLDFLGVSMLLPLYSTHIRDLGASPAVTGLIGSVYGGIQLFSSPMVGRWSDVSGRRRSLVVCTLLTAVSYLAMGFANTVLMTALFRIPTGIFKHSQSISKAYIADTIPKEKVSAVQGKFNSFSSMGFILGPIVGGHVAESLGFYAVSVLCSSLFFINTVLIWFTLPESNSKAHPNLVRNESTVSLKKLASDEYNINPEGFIQSIKQLNWPQLWDLFLIKFFLGFSVLLLRSNFSLILRDKFELTPKYMGYLVSYSGTVSTCFGLFTGFLSRIYNNDMRLYLHLCILLTLTLFALSVASSIWIYIILLTPLGFASTNLRVTSISLMVHRGNKKEIGVLVGLSQSVSSIARMMSPFLSGLLLELHSSAPIFMGAIMASVAVALILWQWSDKEKAKVE